jgi:hypothetical protein
MAIHMDTFSGVATVQEQKKVTRSFFRHSCLHFWHSCTHIGERLRERTRAAAFDSHLERVHLAWVAGTNS